MSSSPRKRFVLTLFSFLFMIVGIANFHFTIQAKPALQPTCSQAPSCSFYVEYTTCFPSEFCACGLMVSCCKRLSGYCLHYPDNYTHAKQCDLNCDAW